MIGNRQEKRLQKTFIFCGFSFYMLLIIPPFPRTFGYKEWFSVQYDPAYSSPNINYTSPTICARHRVLLYAGVRCWFHAKNVFEKPYIVKRGFCFIMRKVSVGTKEPSTACRINF